MRVMIVVTHLLGTGHLARALTLARAYLAAGHDARVVSGGRKVPLLERGEVVVEQLPPLHSNGTDFKRLLGADGAVATPDYYAARQAALLDSLAVFQPDVLITELFPFGRRSLQAEHLALLQAACKDARPPLICSSVRDILAPPSTPEKALKTQNILLEYYDAVLVHSDAAVTPLDTSWPVTPQIRPLLHYTGFVAQAPAPPHPQKLGQGEIIVSAGGGAVGLPVFEAALKAAKQDATWRWRLLVGGQDTTIIAALAQGASDNVTVQAARPDFRQMLHHAAASVSLCGYNTALDVLQTGVPAVFVPFDEGGEVEQGLRADALGQMDGIEVLRAGQLDGSTLLGKLTIALGAPMRAPKKTGLDGAARSVNISMKLRKDKT